MSTSKPKPLAPTVDLDPCTAVAERAAIAEYLAGMPRADADAFALWDVSTIAERSRPAQLGLFGGESRQPERPARVSDAAFRAAIAGETEGAATTPATPGAEAVERHGRAGNGRTWDRGRRLNNRSPLARTGTEIVNDGRHKRST